MNYCYNQVPMLGSLRQQLSHHDTEVACYFRMVYVATGTCWTILCFGSRETNTPQLRASKQCINRVVE